MDLAAWLKPSAAFFGVHKDLRYSHRLLPWRHRLMAKLKSPPGDRIFGLLGYRLPCVTSRNNMHRYFCVRDGSTPEDTRNSTWVAGPHCFLRQTRRLPALAFTNSAISTIVRLVKFEHAESCRERLYLRSVVTCTAIL
jgi:hypothetical protein